MPWSASKVIRSGSGIFHSSGSSVSPSRSFVGADRTTSNSPGKASSVLVIVASLRVMFMVSLPY